MPVLILIALAAWAYFGSPKRDVADWFWKDDAAPWETVDAFYYPDRQNLSVDVRRLGIATVSECRAWVAAQAASRNDPGIQRGSYECGVGFQYLFAGNLRVYRRTVR